MSLCSALRFALVACALGATAPVASSSTSYAADTWPNHIQAAYDVNFNGINVGSYDFSARQDGQNYELSSQAKLSLLLGAFQWIGNTQAKGRMIGEAAKPQAFEFEYQSQSKTGSTKMGFTDETVTQVLNLPPPKSLEGMIPVQIQHLKGVLDPLSAVLAVSRGTPGNPCNKRIPIYDGHQRFDLLLTPKGQIQIDDHQGDRAAGVGYVCQIRYVPIAGYKPDEGTKFMSHNNDIEIILRPMAGANIFIPYLLTIPTMAGPATLVARRVTVTVRGQQQIALVN